MIVSVVGNAVYQLLFLLVARSRLRAERIIGAHCSVEYSLSWSEAWQWLQLRLWQQSVSR